MQINFPSPVDWVLQTHLDMINDDIFIKNCNCNWWYEIYYIFEHIAI